MKEDYLLSVKKAIGNLKNIFLIHNKSSCFILLCLVDFVLRDPRETSEEVKEETLPHRQEIAVLPKPWHSSFVHGQKFIEKNLHSINPAMAQVLSMWHKNVFK
jgi:dynein heavy chain